MSVFRVRTRKSVGALPAFRKSVYLGRVYTAYSEPGPMDTHSPERALPAPPSRPEPKRRPVPRKVRDAIELLVRGDVRTIKAAAARVGYARETLSKMLSRPECSDALRNRAAKEVRDELGEGRREAARAHQLKLPEGCPRSDQVLAQRRWDPAGSRRAHECKFASYRRVGDRLVWRPPEGRAEDRRGRGHGDRREAGRVTAHGAYNSLAARSLKAAARRDCPFSRAIRRTG